MWDCHYSKGTHLSAMYYFYLNEKDSKLYFAGAKMATHPGKDNSIWQTEAAGGEILQEVPALP